MSYWVYFISSLLLMTFQTALIPRLGFVGSFFDLLLPWVIHMAAFRPVPEALPVVIFAGALMDGLSGGPFGLYLTSYTWLFIAVRLAAGVVRMENPMALVLFIILAVAWQNGIFLLAIDLTGPEMPSSGERIRTVSEQFGWVLLAGPLAAFGMRHTQRMKRGGIKAIRVQPVAKEP